MNPWFIWKNKNSLRDYGLWINRLPARVRAEERHEEIEIPGRSGSLIMLEGDDVYSSYSAEMTVTARNSLPIDKILNWLRGTSDIVISTEPEKARTARIAGEVKFDRVGNHLMVATIPFIFQPFKHSVFEQNDRVVITGSEGKIVNPGDVSSRPVVSITGDGSNTISIAGSAMTFANLTGTVVVDCDAQIVTSNGEIWTESVSGDFWTIPTGTSEITQTGNAEIKIDPGWRWF